MLEVKDLSVYYGVIQALKGISDQYGLSFDLSAVAVSRLPDVLSVEKEEADKNLLNR